MHKKGRAYKLNQKSTRGWKKYIQSHGSFLGGSNLFSYWDHDIVLQVLILHYVVHQYILLSPHSVRNLDIPSTIPLKMRIGSEKETTEIFHCCHGVKRKEDK